MGIPVNDDNKKNPVKLGSILRNGSFKNSKPGIKKKVTKVKKSAKKTLVLLIGLIGLSELI